MLGGAATTNLYRMDSTVDGNPIGWTIRTLGTKLPRMLGRAGYSQIAELVDMAAVTAVLPDVEPCARELRATKRNTVKHNRGTHIFEAGTVRTTTTARATRTIASTGIALWSRIRSPGRWSSSRRASCRR
jgi:hypothetical protein